jgi:LCP family protein required for cell wall assembly
MDTDTAKIQWFKVFFLGTLLALGIVIITNLLVLGIVGYFISKPVRQFLDTAEISPQVLKTKLIAGWHKTPELDGSKVTVLLLGIDSLPTRQGDPIMTDTILVVSSDLAAGTVAMVSFPRDIWVASASSKINALYQYGLEKNPANPTELLVNELRHLTDVPIHHVVLITPDQLANLIDLVGGVKVNVPVAFTDRQFPRPDVDIKVERDPKKLYQTINFGVGEQIMTGETALQYMRSRHGDNGQGGDDARIARQQLVFAALSAKVLTKEALTNPVLLGKLWKFYQHHFSTSLHFEELIALIRYRLEHVAWDDGVRAALTQAMQFNFQTSQLTVAIKNPRTGHLSDGVLYNPPLDKYRGQWVYEIIDPIVFKQVVRQFLHYD